MMRSLLLALLCVGPGANPVAAATPVPITPPADTQVTAPAAPDTTSFAAWLAQYRAKAAARGVSAVTLDSVLAGLTPSPRVVELDRAQPGDAGPAPAPTRFDAYLARRLDATRVAAGRGVRERIAATFNAVTARSGVPSSVILGIWGMETNYGRITGDFDVPRSLATLAWDGRRPILFTGELDAVLTIVEHGLAPRASLKGSWAGAMGQAQFLPSSFLAYAADGDGDGKADIWSNDADVAASIANYLARHGWQRGLSWGQVVTLPAGFDRDRVRDLVRPVTCIKPLEKHSRWITIGEWQKLGVTSAAPMPPPGTLATLVEPDGPTGQAYLTTGNYRAIMSYNCSNYYSLSVALLGDAIGADGR